MSSEADALVDAWIWTPVGVLFVFTQLYAIKTGRSGGTALYRWVWRHPRARASFLLWLGATVCHFHKIGPKCLDPYAPLGYLLGPRSV